LAGPIVFRPLKKGTNIYEMPWRKGIAEESCLLVVAKKPKGDGKGPWQDIAPKDICQ
jgi:hypothetical protein